ncbi:hypothetical protein EIN_484810 [Entamoeba invadens IP1]|uniref:Uncharacterized protein n=1 Tax=Entamoeba invadens IP1 TaxID=370355 RepID=A0A0A1U4L4_ENTIV|nr:hypothetical protein EIN_484810 [Entamoeba invadens IP1]ELP89139.1 hypothetical protein EIN_484810 [Entamoeba invadens IP1]|eukprot:XP_004255910.1 hypothetical protein EIN_484810 [Entamoeba invadens IP1]
MSRLRVLDGLSEDVNTLKSVVISTDADILLKREFAYVVMNYVCITFECFLCPLELLKRLLSHIKQISPFIRAVSDLLLYENTVTVIDWIDYCQLLLNEEYDLAELRKLRVVHHLALQFSQFSQQVSQIPLVRIKPLKEPKNAFQRPHINAMFWGRSKSADFKLLE